MHKMQYELACIWVDWLCNTIRTTARGKEETSFASVEPWQCDIAVSVNRECAVVRRRLLRGKQ